MWWYSSEPDSYAGGGLYPRKVEPYRTGQGGGVRQMQSLVLQAGGLGVGLTTRPHKKEQVTKMLMNKNNIMDGHLSTTWAP